MLLVEGGIYSDTDTRLLQPPSKWGQGATLWADGKGLSKQEKARIAAGEEWEEVLGPPSIIVGVEADVGKREDWHDWWARPVSSLSNDWWGAACHEQCCNRTDP
jgi:alpha 1,6-mannosyltransferase